MSEQKIQFYCSMGLGTGFICVFCCCVMFFRQVEQWSDADLFKNTPSLRLTLLVNVRLLTIPVSSGGENEQSAVYPFQR